jgi:oxygen-independent coproporphyrinogen-3 oxidase
MASQAGFQNLTIDLIYGIPTLTDEAWQLNLDTALKLGIPHISAYSLTVEPRTALDVMIRKGKYAPVDETQSIRHFEMLMSFMEKHGYLEYVKSISEKNFPFDSEQLSNEQQYNEYVMTGLRTMWGCNSDVISRQFGETCHSEFISRIRKFMESGMVVETDGVYKLTLSGKLMADGIASDLFIT